NVSVWQEVSTPQIFRTFFSRLALVILFGFFISQSTSIVFIFSVRFSLNLKKNKKTH
ncbi:hypothetical protein ACJX0J_036760, partial [Zea mays]